MYNKYPRVTSNVICFASLTNVQEKFADTKYEISRRDDNTMAKIIG